MNYNCIIPLGMDCSISWLLRYSKLNKETTLFEWFVSLSLEKISNIIYKLGNNIEVNLIPNLSHENISMEDSDIYTSHYSYDEYIPIFNRRKDRFIESVKNNNKILFIRVDFRDYKYTNNDIDSLINSLKCINPNTENMKLLIITCNNLELDNPFLINKTISKDILSKDPSWNNGLAVGEFIKILEEIS